MENIDLFNNIQIIWDALVVDKFLQCLNYVIKGKKFSQQKSLN